VLACGVALQASGEAAAASTAALLEVTPNSSVVWGSSGNAGGPFLPSSTTYTVFNRGTAEPMSWCAEKSQPWITLSTDCGLLGPGASATVTVTIQPAVAAALPADGYSDPIRFTNLTNHTVLTQDGAVTTGFARRFVTLNVLGGAATTFQGFGAGTRGGAGGEVFRVTTLADSGDDANPVPGSLRDAMSRGNRTVVFDVGGTIVLQSFLYVHGDHVTIDGSRAPPPGITLTRYGIIIRGNRGAHDVVVRGLRVRDIVRSPTADTQWDGIQVANGAFNVLIDHVSVHGADDGSIDITSAHDVTVSWSLIGPPKSGKNMLVKYDASRITLHHNLFLDSGTRNPLIEHDDAGTPATTITADMRNNLVWNFGVGTVVARGARVNVVDNYYSTSSLALSVHGDARAYTRGNVVHGSVANINGAGAEAAPFPAAPVSTTDAATAACHVRAGAGALPRDAVDQGLLASVLPASPGGACFTVTVQKAGLGRGTVTSNGSLIDCGSGCSAVVKAGTVLTLTATPAADSAFRGFTGAGDCTDGRLTVTTAVTCVATFDPRTDLVVSAITGPFAAEVGGTAAIRHTTQNAASGTTPATTTGLYLSTTTTIGSTAVLLASVAVAPLAAGQSSVTTSTVLVPAGTTGGTYYVVARADAASEVTETAETNNTRSVQLIVGADLGIPSLVAPGTAARGAPILVSTVTANAASVAPAATSVTRIYLSPDAISSPAEAVAERRLGRLVAGARDTWNVTLTVPPSLAPGTYYLIARADADGEVTETVESNNTRSRPITILP
jgi:pectate lyase